MIYIGIFFFLFALIYLLLLIPNIGTGLQTYALAGQAYNINAAKYFPYLIGIIILLISTLIIIKEWKRKIKPQSKNLSQLNLKKTKDVGSLLIFCLAYVILLEPLGFFLTTPVCLIGCLWFFGLRKWFKLSIIPILTTILIFLCFEELMGIQLPEGVLRWMFF